MLDHNFVPTVGVRTMHDMQRELKDNSIDALLGPEAEDDMLRELSGGDASASSTQAQCTKSSHSTVLSSTLVCVESDASNKFEKSIPHVVDPCCVLVICIITCENFTGVYRAFSPSGRQFGSGI